MNGGKLLKFSIILNLCITLSACGTESAQQPEDSSVSEAEYGWKTEGFMAGDILEESYLYTVDYEKIDYTVPDAAMGADHIQVACGDAYYILDKYYTGQGVVCNYCRINGEEKHSESIALTPDMWNISGGEILGMDVAVPDQCVFWVASDFTDTEDRGRRAGHYYIVSTDAQGNLQGCVDIIDTLQEYEIWKEAPVTYVGTQINCDAQGNIYLCDYERQVVYLLNQEGEFITCYTNLAGEGTPLSQGIHTSLGELIFASGSWDAREFIWMDPKAGIINQLASEVEDLGNIQKWYGMYDDMLYYATREQIIGWKTSTGEKTVLVDLVENAIASATDTSLLVQGETIKLLSTETDKRYVLTFSAEEPVIAADITLVNICSENSRLAGRVAGFSRENPLFAISYQDAGNRERVLVEVMNGTGPDILYVTREDMENLQANGALGDLKQMLSQETLEVLLPGAIAMGTYDDSLQGLPLSVYIRTLLTSKLYWQEDSWNIEDVLSILEEQKELKGMFAGFGGQDQFFYNLFFLMGKDIEHSPFVADGQAGFDSPDFKNVLSWVKKMTNNKDTYGYPGTTLQASATALQEGDYLGVEVWISGMHSFSSSYTAMGEDFQPVGYPTETGKGSYMQPMDGGMIVVNQNAMGKEGIKELLEYLFSLESQRYLAGADSISVRLDIPESQLRYMDDRKQYYWMNPGGDMVLLPTKKDQSSYLDEYVEFIRNAVPSPVHSDELFDIVMEEADSYFLSDKNLDETIRVIQQRVQLYLDERK